MQQKLQTYHTKLSTILTSQKNQLQKIISSYIDTFTKQLHESADRHWKQYQLYKKDLDREMDTVLYYLKLGEYGKEGKGVGEGEEGGQGEGGVGEEGENEKKREEWMSTLKNVNLYSLFKQIDDKLAYNSSMLQQFQFVCVLPVKGQKHYQQLLTRVRIQQQQSKQYSKIISTLLSKLPKTQKTLHTKFLQTHQKYSQLLSPLSPSSLQPLQNHKLHSPIHLTISQLSTLTYPQTLQLEIPSQTGTMTDEDYENLMESIVQHRFYVKVLVIRIMDMEFWQGKCDVVVRGVKMMRNLGKFVMQNYYAECKLGMFVDFNWAPFRKVVNIKAAVWK